MTINTASATVSLARELDNSAASFYRELASKFGPSCASFTAFAAENKKYNDQIERAYYGVITDAIEGCFSFELDPDLYQVDTDVSKIATLDEALLAALRVEEAATRFYKDAAAQGISTMADLGRALILVSRKREERLRKMRRPPL